MTTMTREQAIRSYVEQLSRSELENLLQCMNFYDGSFEESTYYDMDSFDEFMSNYTPSEIARMIHFGEFNPNDDYFRFDAYGNLESFDWQEISDEAESLESDIIDHLVNYYDGDTPWADLDYMVDSDDTAIFNEDFEEVDEDDDDDDDE
ncbi:hypothetical protein [uncultured Megasphaera sp.]|uniref:hypothetical protein n=1 Tax=uncultured Megasphaera sp. TaxID=165188 RepID=UPI0025916194|nr:hypothetical protein [uncultured Megasphaera sp.]